MRLQQYLNEAHNEYTTVSRMTHLSQDEFIDLAKKNCMNAIISYMSGKKIYRGDHNTGNYYFGDARSAEPRVSRNTSNHYTLWMDNHPDWSKYPKRSQSFICSTDETYASSFGQGTTKLILPYDNVDIGVCLKSDLWGSFPRITFIGNSWDASDLNSYINHLMQIINGEINDYNSNGTKYDKSWNILRGSIKDIDRNFGWEDVMAILEDEKVEKVVSAYTLAQLKNFTKTEWKRGKSLMSTLEYLLDPEGNGFEKVTSKNIPSGEHEVWMEGPVLALGEDVPIDDMLKMIVNS